MTGTWFAAKLRDLCSACGLPPLRYTARSLRIGAATTAAAVAPVAALKSMGRWSSSACVRYLRPGVRDVLVAQRAMAGS